MCAYVCGYKIGWTIINISSRYNLAQPNPTVPAGNNFFFKAVSFLVIDSATCSHEICIFDDKNNFLRQRLRRK